MYDDVQIATWRDEYRLRMEKNVSAEPASRPNDFTLAVHASPGDTYEGSKVLLARASFNGTLELLTAAWERVLGYGRQEFAGKTLGKLMRSGRPAAIVAAILDERSMEPVDLTLCCRDGGAKRFTLHRRLDAYAHQVFIVAEETHSSAVLGAPPMRLTR